MEKGRRRMDEGMTAVGAREILLDPAYVLRVAGAGVVKSKTAAAERCTAETRPVELPGEAVEQEGGGDGQGTAPGQVEEVKGVGVGGTSRDAEGAAVEVKCNTDFRVTESIWIQLGADGFPSLRVNFGSIHPFFFVV